MENEIRKVKCYPLTQSLRIFYNRLIELQNVKDEIVKDYSRGLFCKRQKMENIIKIVQSFADSRAEFWNMVIQVYPDLLGKQTSTDGIQININDNNAGDSIKL